MGKSRKVLIFRLSSLGDVVLASRALDLIPGNTQVDWVVGRPSSFLLKNDPRISKLWIYPPLSSESKKHESWKAFLSELVLQDYDQVIDLHSVWRTWYARLFFFFHAKKKPIWKVLTKERLKRLAYILFKGKTPTRYRPTLYRDRVEQFIFASLPGARLPKFEKRDRVLQNRIAIAPGSAWPGKQWPESHWIELLKRSGDWARGKSILLVGRSSEPIVGQILRFAQKASIPLELILDCQDRDKLADAIRTCEYLICNDSFIAHFSEKSGVPVVMLFGPTRKDFGFGPFLDASSAVESPVGCAPCGKDGTNCYYSGDKRHFCQKVLTPDLLIDQLKRRKTPLGLVP
ncbi:MAG: glycosyltransferase family 9 protein [Proteobacteria bacterium]|nr:MAG: glycosyltransferase family 9 protein [Pseudomonadota bacterium]